MNRRKIAVKELKRGNQYHFIPRLNVHDILTGFGSGSLRRRGNNWEVRWRSVQGLPDGNTKYLLHPESSGLDDRDFAQRILNRKLQETGGHRPTVVDPRKVSYEDLRQNWPQD